MNFLNPQTNDKGEPYGPWRYKQIVEELYFITKNCNTSYVDLLDITPIEKTYLIECIAEDIKKRNENNEKQLNAIKQMKGSK